MGKRVKADPLKFIAICLQQYRMIITSDPFVICPPPSACSDIQNENEEGSILYYFPFTIMLICLADVKRPNTPNI